MCHDIQKWCAVSKSGCDYIWNLENVNDNPIYRTEKKTQIIEQFFDSVGEGEGGMFQENSIETCILSRVKQITSPKLEE